jgi:hypothetical protein
MQAVGAELSGYFEHRERLLLDVHGICCLQSGSHKAHLSAWKFRLKLCLHPLAYRVLFYYRPARISVTDGIIHKSCCDGFLVIC